MSNIAMIYLSLLFILHAPAFARELHEVQIHRGGDPHLVKIHCQKSLARTQINLVTALKEFGYSETDANVELIIEIKDNSHVCLLRYSTDNPVLYFGTEPAKKFKHLLSNKPYVTSYEKVLTEFESKGLIRSNKVVTIRHKLPSGHYSDRNRNYSNQWFLFPSELPAPFNQREIEDALAVGFPQKACSNFKYGGIHISFDRDGLLRDECNPDTLYSWGTMSKADRVLKEFVEGKFTRRIYTWKTPIGTYGYGNVALRIKLKPNAVLKFIESKGTGHISDLCLVEDMNKGVVYSHKLDNALVTIYHEWVICDPSAIHSISYGLPEFYDEAIAEITWLSRYWYKGDPASYFAMYFNKEKFGPIFLSRLDGRRWNREAFTLALGTTYNLAITNKGKIRFAPDVDPNYEDHFQTRWPTYFNAR